VKVAIFFFVWYLMWLFLVCLGLMGTGFKLLGGKDSAKMFDVVDNPMSGVMIGILATVLVQSSSTSTSIIIGLVGADEMSVSTAIPMVMGACATNYQPCPRGTDFPQLPSVVISTTNQL
jgi:sodium-dependent phosphate cotransporter